MSGLYNMIMGRNPAFPLLMGAIGIHKENGRLFGRVRDCWISEDAKTIGVLHRNYGDAGAEANGHAAALPTFREHQACGSDNTYAYWIFDAPDGEGTALPQILEKIAEMSDNVPCMDRYLQAIEDFKAGKKNEQTERMLEVGEKVMGQLKQSMEDGQSRSVENDDGGVDIFTIMPKKGDEE
jgi:hypothetical protein